ncbi:hypothetical protein Tco_1509236 [Tanacetum coccineum]
MLKKVKSPLCVENKLKFAPLDYSKENYLATFTPQRDLTPKQIFWSKDEKERKRTEASVPKPLLALTVYPPNTPAKLIPRVLPTKRESHQLVSRKGKGVLNKQKEVKEMKEIFDQMIAKVDKNVVYKKCAEVERKNLLIKNENLIAKLQQKVHQSNVSVIPSRGVSSSTEASGSKPRSNTKNNRILSAKSENKKKVEDHPRINKYRWTKVNRVYSSINSKCFVINSNSESVCKTCNKCLIFANHDMCVVKTLNSINATHIVKNELNKAKKVWKAKGKLSANGLNKTKQVWKATGKLFANVGYQWRPTRKKFTLGEQCPLTRLLVKCTTISANQ